MSSTNKILQTVAAASEFGDPVYMLLLTDYRLMKSGLEWKILENRSGRGRGNDGGPGTQVQICWMDYTSLKMWGLKLKVPIKLEEGTNTDKLDLPKVDGRLEVREVWEPKIRRKVPEISFSPAGFLEGPTFSERNASFHEALKALEKIVLALILRHGNMEDEVKDDDGGDTPGGRFRRKARGYRY